MFRLLSVLLLAASFSKGCVAYEFEHEFWVRTDGSGSFVVTAPPWVWNAVKNVGDARDVDGTVTVQSVSALFDDPAILRPRVKKVTRAGRPYITVSADFASINGLVGTRAFPDLAISMRPEGNRLKLVGVWRRPPGSGTAQGADDGLMAVRFHLPSEIVTHRNASMGVERGNILSWRQDLRDGLAGVPLDLGATMGTRSVLRATLGLFAVAILAGLALIAATLLIFWRRGQRRARRRRGRESSVDSDSDADFLNYDPGKAP